ncbi:MAG: glycosyltransferase family 4 protein [Proteiniphilum sp.]|uniref:glycosyltransferase family 4 protein n=1 Tax=Proteiniphilum sp. TaxID=1926877 RepID=UPI002ABBBBE9|nr:glycosyltransferase family 4 protein [Proteiniphilum sp.]MDY9918312.1 glycosyltransferase family 4 protein [Proteiniphilum sp.]
MSPTQKDILYLLHLPPPVHGYSIIGEQIKESKLINDVFKGRYINLILSRKVHVRGKAGLVKIVRFVKIWFLLLGKLIHRKPVLCYYALTTTGSCFHKDILLTILLRFFRVKIIYHVHNKGIIQAREKKLNHLLYRFVFKNTSVILLSRHLYHDIEPYVAEDHVYYCPNGIKDYEPSAALVTLPENRPFNILFFSNLVEEKGVFVLMEACSILKNKGYSFQCDFVGGEGDISEKRFNVVVREKGLTEQVKYLGTRHGLLKEMAFEQADVFVLPSRYDYFPLVILEAMQHNLPVIAAYEGGIPDMVDEGSTGFLFSPYDNAQALADRLELLMFDPVLRKQIGINGRIKYENNFTLPIFEQRLLNILQKVINK